MVRPVECVFIWKLLSHVDVFLSLARGHVALASSSLCLHLGLCRGSTETPATEKAADRPPRRPLASLWMRTHRLDPSTRAQTLIASAPERPLKQALATAKRQVRLDGEASRRQEVELRAELERLHLSRGQQELKELQRKLPDPAATGGRGAVCAYLDWIQFPLVQPRISHSHQDSSLCQPQQSHQLLLLCAGGMGGTTPADSAARRQNLYKRGWPGTAREVPIGRHVCTQRQGCRACQT